jgi:hypothetical protein
MPKSIQWRVGTLATALRDILAAVLFALTKHLYAINIKLFTNIQTTHQFHIVSGVFKLYHHFIQCFNSSERMRWQFFAIFTKHFQGLIGLDGTFAFI